MRKIVMGLVGPIASGKGYLADHLKESGFDCYSLSDRVREEADRRGLPKTRSTLQDVGNDLRETFGRKILAQRTRALIDSRNELILIDSIRNLGELNYLKETMGALIVGIDAPVELRQRWYLERAWCRGEDSVTVADFERADRRDQGEGEMESGQQGLACLETADARIYNDGTARIFKEAETILWERLGLKIEGGKKRIEIG